MAAAPDEAAGLDEVAEFEQRWIDEGVDEAQEVARKNNRSEGAELGRKAGRAIAAEFDYYRGFAVAISALPASSISDRARQTSQRLASAASVEFSREDPEASLAAVRSQARLLFRQIGLGGAAEFPLENKPKLSLSSSFTF